MHTYPLQDKLIYELKVLLRARVIVLMLFLLLIRIETADKMYSMVEELKLFKRCLQESDKCKKNVNRAWIWIIFQFWFYSIHFKAIFHVYLLFACR